MAAQIGYPGQYPPGRYPGGGPPGTGLPRRGGKTTTKEKDPPVATKEIEGLLRKLDDKLIVWKRPTRASSRCRGDETKFLKDDEAMKPADLKPGDHLRVEATEDEQGFFYAVNVNFTKAGTAEERAKASEPVEVIMPSAKYGDDRGPARSPAGIGCPRTTGEPKPHPPKPG